MLLIQRIGSAFDILGSEIMEVAPTLTRNMPDEPARTGMIAAHFAIEQLKIMLKQDFIYDCPFRTTVYQLQAQPFK